jgi:hypothetical protein
MQKHFMPHPSNYAKRLYIRFRSLFHHLVYSVTHALARKDAGDFPVDLRIMSANCSYNHEDGTWPCISDQLLNFWSEGSD